MSTSYALLSHFIYHYSRGTGCGQAEGELRVRTLRLGGGRQGRRSTHGIHRSRLALLCYVFMFYLRQLFWIRPSLSAERIQEYFPYF